MVSILLHAHLPFGLRPELPFSLEEAWLHEAVLGCYVPLLRVLEQLPELERPHLAASISPTLLEMWAHPAFRRRHDAHLARGIDILKTEAANAEHPPERRALAKTYRAEWESAQRYFTAIDGDLTSAWAEQAERGIIELLTTAATHAFLPAQQHADTRRSQIELGIRRFRELTGVDPAGFWLPECGYFPGLEDDLAAVGVRWFGVEDMGGPRVRECPNGVRAIARHGGLSRRVWDARIGYPGNAVYREFHRDATHELPDVIAGIYRDPKGQNLPLGLKYWCVTGKPDKQFYDPDAATEQARRDASIFAREIANAPPTDVTFLPFDAELFGHWWFEGPQFLQALIHEITAHPKLALAAPTAALEMLGDVPVARPTASTWGRQADYSFWINHETDWIYPLLAHADQTFGQLAEQAETLDEEEAGAFCQLTRELLLAQASDWPFMIRSGATANYARERIQRHLGRFHFLAGQIKAGSVDAESWRALEQLNPILPGLTVREILAAR